MKINSKMAISLSLSLCALSAFLLVLLTTPYGLGISPDSAVYFRTARSILAGEGFLQDGGRLMTHYPPVYPLLLALAGLFGKTTAQAAIWLHAFFFAADVLLIGILAYIAVNRNLKAALCCAALFLSCASMLEIHTMAWSEPPFIAFSLASVILLTIHIQAPRYKILIASAVFLGLALATRYVGITLLPPMIAALVFFKDSSLKAKIKDCLIFLLIGTAPLAVWLIRNMIAAGTVANRRLVFHPITMSHIKKLSYAAYELWLPVYMADWLRIPLLLSLCIIVIAVFRAVAADQSLKKPDAVFTVQFISMIFCVIYIAFLLFSISFVDAATPPDARLLSPVYVFGTVLAVSLSVRIKKSDLTGKLFAILWFLLICINMNRVSVLINIMYHEGPDGYNSPIWSMSQSVNYVRSLPKEIIIYTNGHDVISFLTERDAKMIPPKMMAGSLSPNTDFQKNSKVMCEELAQKKAVIVYLYRITWRWYLPTPKELENLCGIPPVSAFDDGLVYVVKGQGVR